MSPTQTNHCCWQVVPAISKLFASNDRGIRRSLLENINSFGPAMPNSLVEEQVCCGACKWVVMVVVRGGGVGEGNEHGEPGGPGGRGGETKSGNE